MVSFCSQETVTVVRKNAEHFMGFFWYFTLALDRCRILNIERMLCILNVASHSSPATNVFF